MWLTYGKSFCIYLWLHLNLSLAQQLRSKFAIKNASYLGPQISLQLSRLSRDGGASVLLNGHVVWLFDDTEITSKDDRLLVFVSNTAAYSHAPQGNLTLLQDFEIWELERQSSGEGAYPINVDKSLNAGSWIPFDEDELAFNRQDPGRERVAIWPGTNPTPLNPTAAILYAPLVYVETANKTAAKKYKAQGVTLVFIRAGHGGPTAFRASDVLFSSDDIPYGVFSAILGEGRDSVDLDIYLFGIVSQGLQLARVKSNNMKILNAYEYLKPASCSFTRTPPSPASSNLSNIYLAGNYSSGSIFYSPFWKTFLLVYFNNEADSTFYMRYLDLDVTVCPTDVWINGGKYGIGIQADDVEAVFRYAWAPEQILYKSPPGPKGFNYAGLAHPEFFNNQYYARCMYWYRGIDSDMESGWFGGGLIEQKQAQGDGRHLLLSWTSQEQGLDGNGRYQVMLAKVEFDAATIQSPATPPAGPGQITHSPTGSTGRSVCHDRIWSQSWQIVRSASILPFVVSFHLGLG